MSNVFMNDEGQELRDGDHWFVRLNMGSPDLSEIILDDVTFLTVKFHIRGNYTEYRRETKNIKFIEKAKQ
jgi:hypothetical protein